jgi:hypothetical protein
MGRVRDGDAGRRGDVTGMIRPLQTRVRARPRPASDDRVAALWRDVDGARRGGDVRAIERGWCQLMAEVQVTRGDELQEDVPPVANGDAEQERRRLLDDVLSDPDRFVDEFLRLQARADARMEIGVQLMAQLVAARRDARRSRHQRQPQKDRALLAKFKKHRGGSGSDEATAYLMLEAGSKWRRLNALARKREVAALLRKVYRARRRK